MYNTKGEYDKLIDVYAKDLDRLRRLEELHKQRNNIIKLKYENGYNEPYIVDFAGTPKAGVTTTIQIIEDFLKTGGFNVKTIKEENEKIKDLEKIMYIAKNGEYDFVFLDKGFLDSAAKHMMNSNDNKLFFLAMKKYLKDINKIINLKCDPMEAARREYFNRLTLNPDFNLFPDEIDKFNQNIFKAMLPFYEYVWDTLNIDTTKKDKMNVAMITCEVLLNSYQNKIK